MAETWTTITTHDDPGSGHEFDKKGRVWRDNDDTLTRVDSSQRAADSTLTGFNQTNPNVIATGVKLRWFKPAHAKKVSFRYYFARTSPVGAYRAWARVRFNNDANLQTPLWDTGVDGNFPAVVTDFDVSSLAEGVYDVELYAGHDGAAGDNFIGYLPSGVPIAETNPPSVPNDNDFTSVFRHSDVDWSATPSSDLTDADLTADKGHTETKGQKWFDRDEKLRRRPAGFMVSLKSSTSVDPSFTAFTLGTIYVPKWADVLRLEALVRIVNGGTVTFYLSAAELEAAFPFHNVNVSGPATPDNSTTSATAVRLRPRVNLSPLRGTVATLKLWMAVSQAGSTGEFSIGERDGGHNWEVGPIPSQQKIALDWRSWLLEARQKGALLHAAWWRRMASRDKELQERQMLQRGFSVTSTGLLGSYAVAGDSQMKIYQPKGIGALGGKLVATMEIASASGNASDIKLDYTDQPDGDGPNQILGLLDGIYKIERTARSDRDGTEVQIGAFAKLGASGVIYRCQNTERGRMRWET